MNKTMASPHHISFVLAFSLCVLQSCTTVVQTEFRKGFLLDTRTTEKLVVLENAAYLEVASPLTVKVYEIVQVADEITRTYEKIKLEVTKNPLTRDGDYYEDQWYNHRCGGNLTCKSTIAKDDYITDKWYDNKNKIKRNVTSGTVQALINGSYTQDLTLNSDGTASVSIEKYYDVLPKGKDVNIVYSYQSTSAQSTVTWYRVEKTVRALLPEYRKRGATNKTAADYLIAFRISDDPSDLKDAYKYAANESERAEIKKVEDLHTEKLDRIRFEQAKDKGELEKFIRIYPNSRRLVEAQYLYHLDKDCNGSVIRLSKFNIRLDKGRCVVIVATKFQSALKNSGLFKTFFTWKGDERDLFYIEFPTDTQHDQVRALTKIKGVYKYTTIFGTPNAVPHLRFLSEIPED